MKTMKWRRLFQAVFISLVLSMPCRIHAQSGPPLPPPPLGELLGIWRFDDTNWLTAGGFPPLSFTNIDLVPDWDVNAVQVDSTNAAWISYNMVETNGHTNLTLGYGSVLFWFLPNWSSTNEG